MILHTHNPGAEAGVAGGLVKALGGAIDYQQHNHKAPENLAVAYVSRRYRLTPCMARLVCELARIGGRFA
jgi:hypothetical protein